MLMQLLNLQHDDTLKHIRRPANRMAKSKHTCRWSTSSHPESGAQQGPQVSSEDTNAFYFAVADNNTLFAVKIAFSFSLIPR